MTSATTPVPTPRELEVVVIPVADVDRAKERAGEELPS
jgi:hypothetical protein